VKGDLDTIVVDDKVDLNRISYHFKSKYFLQSLNDRWYEIAAGRINKYHPGSIVDFSTDEL
jgi:hypothetical protein